MNDYLKIKYKNEINVIQTSIEEFDLKNNKSNFIISSFGFPSTLFDKDKYLKELNMGKPEMMIRKLDIQVQ